MSQPPPSFPPPPQWPSPGSQPTGRTNKPLLWFAAVAIALAVIVVVALVAVLLTRGDDSDDSAKGRPTDAASQPSQPSEPATTETSTTPAPVGPDNTAVVGEWYGRYRCTQGASAGRLIIEAVPGSSTQVTAVFRFGESIINDNVEQGSYRMTGEVTDSEITLTAGEWIKQAPGYATVDLTAPVTSDAPTELYGDVLSQGCQRFRFLKQ